MKYHKPWKYKINNKTYIKIGAYGTDDLEYIENKMVYFPELKETFVSLDLAYEYLNKTWEHRESQLNEKG